MRTKSLISKAFPCPHCARPAKKNGSFVRKRNRVKVQRFYCETCSLAFSKQTNNISKKQHRPDLNEKIFVMVANGMGIRRIAQALHTTPKTVQKKMKFLAILCEKFHLHHFANWKVKPKFQFDEMWSIEKNRFNALTIPLVVEKESYFIVSARSAHTYSLSGHPSIKAKSDYERWGKISIRDLVILKTLDRVNTMKPFGRIFMDTDKKVPYMNFLKNVFGYRLIHKRHNASNPLEAIKLFPINNTMACMRAELGKVKRVGWYLTKDNMWLNAHLAIYTVYYNYFRVKKYTKPHWTLPTIPVVAGKKTKKEWEHKTPAMKLGIFDEPISFKFLVENYKPKSIPTTANNVIPISRQLPSKKVA